MITQRDVQDALDLEHRLLMQHNTDPPIFDAQKRIRWIAEKRRLACTRLNAFARRNFMPFPDC